MLTVPASCTDRLQSLDTSVNKAVKEFLPVNFRNGQICSQLGKKQTADVTADLALSIVKPLV